MKLVLSGAALLCSLTVAATSFAQENIAVYSTGVDGAEAPIAQGVVDSHWDVQYNATGWVDAVQGKTNFCSSCGNIWLNHPAGDDTISRPIAHPSYVETTAAGQKFSWRQSFTVPANADLNTVNIAYHIGFDDVSRNATDTGDLAAGCTHTVWVNGTAHNIVSTGNNHQTTCTGTIPASSLVHGQNTIEYRIQNLATYYGFRWELVDASFTAVPSANVTLGYPTAFDQTNDTTPTLSGTASVGSIVTVTIRDSADMVVETLTPTVDANGNWTVDASALVDGSYTVEALAELNNTTATAGPVDFIIDTTAPTIVMSSPTDGDVIYSMPTAVSGDASSDTETIVIVVRDANGDVVTTIEPTSLSFTTQLGNLTPGDYTLEVTVADELGNEATTTVSFTYALGAVTITMPVDGDTTSSLPTITGTAINFADIKVWIDGTENGTTTVDNSGGWTYTLTTALAAGAHTVQASNTDGSVLSDSVMFNVAMDVVPAPVAISAPMDGATLEAGDITVSGTGEPNTTVVVSVGESEQTVTVDANGDWTATFTAVEAGEYTVSATGADDMTVTVAITVNDATVNNGTNNATNNATNNSTNNSTNNGTNNATNNGNTNGTDDNNSVGTDDGCGCASTDGNATSALLLLLGLFGMRLRRRSR